MSDRLTARDIQNQQFSKKMRGYEPAEVELFLQSVAEEVERITLENGEMLEELGKLRSRVDELRKHERTLQETLISAQRMTEDMKARADHESELVVKEARIRADRMQHEAQDTLTRLEADISRSKLDREVFERQLRSLHFLQHVQRWDQVPIQGI